MHKIRQVIRNIPTSTKEILFFGAIFTIYFMSSVGIMNTMDGAQFFTTEALLETGKIDLAPMMKYEHFYAGNDLAYEGKKIIPLRGVFQSILAMPLHLIAERVSGFVSVSTFPTFIGTANKFANELIICALFSAFSVFGLIFLYHTLRILHINKIVITLTVLLTAFGTPVWKYSTAYIRQGIAFLFFSLFFYLLTSITFREKARSRNVLILAALMPIIFGVDPLTFASIIIGLVFYIISTFHTNKNLITIIRQHRRLIQQAITSFLTVLLLVLGINMYYFGSPFSTHYEKYPPFASIPKEKLVSVVFGTPILPTLNWVIFGSSPIPLKSFETTVKYPQVSKVVSVEYAMKYSFYGIFIISPIFLLIFSSAFSFFKKANSYVKLVYLSSLISTVSFILPTTMWHAFHAPNSYDVKYFYPIYALLAIMLGLGINVWPQKRGMPYKLIFSLLSLLTIFFGIIGVFNAYPAFMTGERRIWINTFFDLAKATTIGHEKILNAVIPNRQNAPIAMAIVAIIYLLSSLRMIKRSKNLRDQKVEDL